MSLLPSIFSDATPGTPVSTRTVLRLSYAQAVLFAIYTTSTSSMFLVGFAMLLGKDLHPDRLNVLIGLMTTFPMFCVIGQLLSAMRVERGVSRRGLAFYAGLVNALLWPLIVLIPVVGARVSLSSEHQLYALIALVTLIAFFLNICLNARATWIGDLIPERIRGPYFGRMTMFAAIIGTASAIIVGAGMDYIKTMGPTAFSLLFVFGTIFGLGNVLLFRPQPDTPPARTEPIPFGRLFVNTFKNKPLLAATGFMLVIMLQAVAGPFYAKYVFDIGVSFFGLSILNAVFAGAMLISAPFWGRMVKRFGCRPVMILAVLILGPVQTVWIFVDTPERFYWLIPPANILAGLANGALAVGSNTLLYKVTPAVGRSVQLAIQAIVVAIVAAPLPFFGGHLPPFLRSLGIESADLRWTFYLAGTCHLLGGLVGKLIREDNAQPLSRLIKHLLNGNAFRRQQDNRA